MGHESNINPITCFPMEAVSLLSPHLLFLYTLILQLLPLPLIYCHRNGITYTLPIAYTVQIGTY